MKNMEILKYIVCLTHLHDFKLFNIINKSKFRKLVDCYIKVGSFNMSSYCIS